MPNAKGFFDNLFGKAKQPGIPDEAAVAGSAPGAQPRALAHRSREFLYRVGDLIDVRYEVLGVLGAGGFGEVYLVARRGDKTRYALKVLHNELTDNPGVKERFRREAEIWIDLGWNLYIVRALSVDEVKGHLCIVVQYIAPSPEGLTTLEDYLRRKPPTLNQALEWAVQFCHGMKHAYGHGLRCHRDIKPSNILIGRDWMTERKDPGGDVVKISDFGIASAVAESRSRSGVRFSAAGERIGLSSQTMEGVGFGTPPYMPPEQFASASECDEKSDIYSFGVVMYQLAAGGKLPFPILIPRNGSEEEAARCWWGMYHLHRDSPVPRLDSPLFPVIRRCLQKVPTKRYLGLVPIFETNG